MSSGNYTVLARKYRPQKFEEVIGQDAVVRTLANALRQQRIAHAYCFSGIRGVGKTTAARILAKGLNCRRSPDPTAEPCGTCESCVEIERSQSLDVVELDAASQTQVENMRELTAITRYAPSRDRYRVFIIDEAHMLSTHSFNALLKTLEEPPPHVVFILATTEPNKILPTVLSRCQLYEFGRVSQGQIGGYLGDIAERENVSISEDALALLATAADGSVRDGQSLLDKLIAFSGNEIDEQTVVDLLGLVERVLLFRAVDLIGDQDLPGVLGLVNEMVDSGVDLHQFTLDLLGHFRNLLVVRTVPDPGPILHLPEADLDRLRQQAESFEIDDLDRGFSLLAASEYRIKSAEQPRYHLEIVMARLARMPRLQPIEQLIAALEGDGGGSPAPGGGGGGGGSSRGRTVGGSQRRASASPRPSAAPTASAPSAPDRAQEPAPRHRPNPSASTPRTPAASQPAREPEPGTRDPQTRQRATVTPIDVGRPEAAGTNAAVTPASEPRPEAEAPQKEPPAPEVASPETVRPGPAVAEATTGAEPGAEMPEAEAPQMLSRLLQKIRDELEKRHPMAGSVLGRVSGLRLAGERIVFQLPESAGIFIRRLQEPEMVELLGEAAETVLGRRVVAGVEADPKATRPLLSPVAEEAPTAPEPERVPPGGGSAEAEKAERETLPMNEEPATLPAAAAVEPPLPDPEPAPATLTLEEPEESDNGRNGGGSGQTAPQRAAAPRPEPPGLRERVESEPLVQEFLRAMRGEITSVEELEDER